MKHMLKFMLLGVSLCAGNAALADDNRVGIKECDDYLDQYQTCLNEKVPKESRDALATSLSAMRTSWKTASANTAAKESLAQTCVQARQAAKSVLSAYGCTNF